MATFCRLGLRRPCSPTRRKIFGTISFPRLLEAKHPFNFKISIRNTFPLNFRPKGYLRTKSTPDFYLYHTMQNPKILKIDDGILFLTYMWQKSESVVEASTGEEEPLTGAFYFGKATVNLPTISDLNGRETALGEPPSSPWRHIAPYYDGRYNAQLFLELEANQGHDFAGNSRLHSHFDIPFRGRSYGVTGTRLHVIPTDKNSLY